MEKKRILSLLTALVFCLSAMAGVFSAAAEAPAAEPAETTETSETPEEAAEEEIVYPDELQVGHTTVLKGDFFTEMFGNNTSDIDVRALIHGYNLVNWDQNQGTYLFDESVVETVQVADDEIGNRTYYLALYDDLYYSDGTPITAWDYAFSLLLMMSPEIEQIGGKIYRAEHILGYADYISGRTPYLAGVGVIDEHQLSITLDHDFLPYFFETGLMLCVPYPIHVLAPGCRVYAGGLYDMGEGYGTGVWIGNIDQSIEERLYTPELLAKTILDPETGYNSHPSVSSGPYILTEYDSEKAVAHFRINDYFKGAWAYSTLPENYSFEIQEYAGVGHGTITHNSHTGPNIFEVMRYDDEGNEKPIYLVKPTIEKISLSLADNDTMAQDLAEGKFQLVNKVAYGPTIQQCNGTYAYPEGETGPDMSSTRMTTYPRIGLAFLTFSYDWPTVHEKEVRQAIAWCMDRDQLTQDYCQGFGVVVNGYFGIEQWEYLICQGQAEFPVHLLEQEQIEQMTEEQMEELGKHKNMTATTQEEYESMMAAWDSLSLDHLTKYGVYDLENDPERTEKLGVHKAIALLEYADWTLNREGKPFQAGVDDVRCKMIDGELVALDLKMMYPRGNHIVDTLQENFIDNLNEAGIQLTLVPEDMEPLLRSYYRETERTTDMIYLATNFHVVVDPAITYSADTSENHQQWNNTYSDDEELWQRAVNMRKTDPKDIYEYVTKWVSFQERYNEVLPTIPVYSNIYFDFFSDQLQNYYITAHATWPHAILEAYFGEAPEEPEEPEEDAAAEDTEEFED